MSKQRGPDLLMTGRDHEPIVTHQLAVPHATWEQAVELVGHSKPGKLLNRFLESVMRLSMTEKRMLIAGELGLTSRWDDEPEPTPIPEPTPERGTIFVLSRGTTCDTCGRDLWRGSLGLLYSHAPKRVACMTCVDNQVTGLPLPHYISVARALRERPERPYSS